MHIAVGMDVMITRNIETDLDITNGARGQVVIPASERTGSTQLNVEDIGHFRRAADRRHPYPLRYFEKVSTVIPHVVVDFSTTRLAVYDAAQPKRRRFRISRTAVHVVKRYPHVASISHWLVSGSTTLRRVAASGHRTL